MFTPSIGRSAQTLSPRYVMVTCFTYGEALEAGEGGGRTQGVGMVSRWRKTPRREESPRRFRI